MQVYMDPSSLSGKKQTRGLWGCWSLSQLQQSGLGASERGEIESLLVCCWCLCIASCLEWLRVLKTQRLPLSLQNLFLYAFGVALNLASHLLGALVWLIIAGQVTNSLLMFVVMKHGTGITRLFVISSAMLSSPGGFWEYSSHLTSCFLWC
ncbi:putative UDP-sugar transporter protein SLC35A4 [Triplophysa rosa]|uniref:UDP-sugar transporter protein SLC35A4 n=1 Tax=Triplophysa rosa TaxID=992332 RepID=A0A9W7T3P0_TRIRA|nr:putative UDP-sugar transporter protein SLC35A4 [Triplophysa rosa]